MTTHAPTFTPMSHSLARAAAKGLLASGLLALTACSGDAIDSTELDAELFDAEQEAPDSPEDEIAVLEQPLLGSDACRNADIRVLNSLPYTITVKKVEYYNGSEGRWQTEDLANRPLDPGVMEFWSPNLEHAENDWIYSWNVIYDHTGHNGHSYHINTPDVTCIPGRVFFLELD